MIRRRELEEVGLSFLDVICCGFGAIILLLMIVKIAEPIVLEAPTVDLEGVVVQKRDSLHAIQGQTRELNRQLSDKERQLASELATLARVEKELSEVLARYLATEETADRQVTERSTLTRARQSLSAEMERLLGLDFTRADNTIAGIPVDSEYIIFVIDTSGSMYGYAWRLVRQKVSETLEIYPTVKGIQVLNDMGDYMFDQYAGRWIQGLRGDSPQHRAAHGHLERVLQLQPGGRHRAGHRRLLRRGQEHQHLRLRRRFPRQLHRGGGRPRGSQEPR